MIPKLNEDETNSGRQRCDLCKALVGRGAPRIEYIAGAYGNHINIKAIHLRCWWEKQETGVGTLLALVGGKTDAN